MGVHALENLEIPSPIHIFITPVHIFINYMHSDLRGMIFYMN
jgi:hypothetical protein